MPMNNKINEMIHEMRMNERRAIKREEFFRSLAMAILRSKPGDNLLIVSSSEEKAIELLTDFHTRFPHMIEWMKDIALNIEILEDVDEG